MLDVHAPDSADSTDPFPNVPDSSERLLADWDRDIVRAASVAAARPLMDSRTEDLAQDARLQIFRAFRQGRPTAKGYIRRVIANAVRNSRRREARAFRLVDLIEPVELEKIKDDTIVEPDDENSAKIDNVAAWVLGLSARLQTIFSLLYVCCYTQREAAAILRLSQPRVAQLHRELLLRGRLELAPLAS